MDTNTKILVDSGMPLDKVLSMSDEFREFIVKTSGPEFEYVPCISEEASGDAPIKLSLTSTKTEKNGKIYYHIYPEYESTEPIKPIGNDAFAFVVDYGMSVEPNEFNGYIYYKENTTSSEWVWDGSLSTSEESTYGYSISGKQLGTPDSPIYLKGRCFFVLL